VVVPETHGQDHTLLEGSTNSLQSTAGLKSVRVPDCGLLLGAERVGDAVHRRGNACQVGVRVLDDHAILDVEPAYFTESSRRRVVGRDEL
jgi:hypothetical protein